MIRFLMCKKEKRSCGLETEIFYTIDHNLHMLEVALTAGGFSEDSYEKHILVGVEVKEQKEGKDE
jgi:hypothetical protein